MIREINSSDWPAFCKNLSQQHSGATVKLEVIETDGVKSELAANAVFQSMSLNKADSCSDTITLRLRTAREVVREIIEPIKMLLHPSGKDGDFNQLQIEAESGVILISFHPAIHADMLKGLKPH
jgi:hypothetical protein